MTKRVLRVQLLGGFRLTHGDRLATNIDAPRLQSLLAYLVLHRDAPQSRQHLAFLLWQDSAEAQARTNLRKALHLLRQTLPAADDFIFSDAQTVQWRADARFSLDVAEFDQAAQSDSAAALQQAVELYRGDLLPSCYDDWIVPERERLRDRFTQVLEQLTAWCEEQRDYASATRHAQRLVRCDPLRELTYRELMRLSALSGDRAGIARAYNTCVTVLQNEIGLEPSAETRNAYEQSLKIVPPELVAPAQARESVAQPNNLPLQLSSFIGREREMRQVEKCLAAHRLVSLTGAGGVGKTRLAQAVAANLLNTFRDGVWFVDLAPLDDPKMVPQAIAATLKVQAASDASLLDPLVRYVRDKHLLLLLDNCERLVQAVGVIVEAVLRAAPQARILETSRQALGIPGEVVWRVPPLSVPDVRRAGSTRGDGAWVSVLAQSESVRLFTDRAAAVLPTFALTDENAQAVASICQRLDGVPLAIELAAARIRLLTAQQIAERLDDAFRLLMQAGPTALPHHQTLQATMDWSHRLLSNPEQTLLRRMSVFSGGFTLDAVEGVCGVEPLSLGEILNELSHLVDKSLVEVESQGNSARYRLLETVREYARIKLTESGEAEAIEQRHFDFFFKLSKDAQPVLASAEHGPWLNRLEQDHDNLRAALHWVIGQQDKQVETALGLLENMLWLWSYGGHWSEARGWFDQILALPGASALKRARAGVLYAAGWLAVSKSDCAWATALAEEGLTINRELEDKVGIAGMFSHLGTVAELLGDYDRAESLLKEGLALRSEMCHAPRITGMLLVNLGRVHMLRGEHVQARELFEEALALHRASGDLWHSAWCVLFLGWLSIFQGEIDTAVAIFQESLTQFLKTGERFGTITYNLLGFAAVAFFRGRFAQAARLAGALETLSEATGFRLPPGLRPMYDGLEAMAREQLGETAFAAVWDEGRAMSQEQAIAYAMAVSSQDPGEG